MLILHQAYLSQSVERQHIVCECAWMCVFAYAPACNSFKMHKQMYQFYETRRDNFSKTEEL